MKQNMESIRYTRSLGAHRLGGPQSEICDQNMKPIKKGKGQKFVYVKREQKRQKRARRGT